MAVSQKLFSQKRLVTWALKPVFRMEMPLELVFNAGNLRPRSTLRGGPRAFF